MAKKEGTNWWKIIGWGIVIIFVLNIISNYSDKYEEENCNLEFSTYTYNDGCASACSSKCNLEGFGYDTTSSGYFEPYLSAEQMADYDLYKRCACNCGGCRE